jgi:hypothetical protein
VDSPTHEQNNTNQFHYKKKTETKKKTYSVYIPPMAWLQAIDSFIVDG